MCYRSFNAPQHDYVSIIGKADRNFRQHSDDINKVPRDFSTQVLCVFKIFRLQSLVSLSRHAYVRRVTFANERINRSLWQTSFFFNLPVRSFYAQYVQLFVFNCAQTAAWLRDPERESLFEKKYSGTISILFDVPWYPVSVKTLGKRNQSLQQDQWRFGYVNLTEILPEPEKDLISNEMKAEESWNVKWNLKLKKIQSTILGMRYYI